MALEFMDDDELVYQAKAAAKNIVSAKYEVTQKVGDFLFLAHSEEEFYQRAQVIDQVVDSTATRRLASVSDSKAKLVKALFQEWEIKHASCDECARANFNSLNKVAFPIFPTETTTRKAGPGRSAKLWDKWPSLHKKKDGTGLVRRFLFDEKDEKGNLKVNPERRDIAKVSIMDSIVGRSMGRLDNPEVFKQVRPGSAVWVDPYGLYGPDKKRKASRLKGRGEEITDENRGESIDPSHLTAMVGRVHGINALADNEDHGIFTTHHNCTGNSFRGFNNNQSLSFPQCTHEHHEGDGCGLTSQVAADGTTQPGCGKPHVVVSALTPQFFNERNEQDGSAKVTPLPYLDDEKPRDTSTIDPAERQRQLNTSASPAHAEANYFMNPSDEQVGEVPMDRMFLLHPEDSARFADSLDQYHTSRGGKGRHPANLDTFRIGKNTHRVGDLVSLTRGAFSRHQGVENDLGVVVGASGHQNGEHVRFGTNSGLGPNTDRDSSKEGANPGEPSLIVHRINSPISGKLNPTAVDPDTGAIAPHPINETTQYYPSSLVNTVQKFEPNKTDSVSKLYGALKSVQRVFNAKPKSERPVGRPKTIKPTRDNLDVGEFDLNSLFE